MGETEPESPLESKAGRLEAVGDQASVCTACDLAATRHKVVFGEGSPTAPLVFVGEGPGQNEDATGRPFVGRAGILLDECLRENGITRKHIYICNVIKCRACMMEAGRIKNRAPRQDEVDACMRWLDQQLTIIAPLVIVCLGGPAANTLIHKGFRMLQERGQWFTTCRYAPYAMAALHPAFILRQEGPAYEDARRSLVEDIGAARRKVIEARKEPPRTLF
jgi:uracil-DNA glycosylase